MDEDSLEASPFASKGSSNHTDKVSGESRNNLCDICNKTLKTIQTLRLHKKYVHDKKRNFECEICKKLSSTRRNHLEHIKVVHDRIKDFECSICGKRFGLLQHLNNHCRPFTSPSRRSNATLATNLSRLREISKITNYLSTLKRRITTATFVQRVFADLTFSRDT